MKILAAYFSVIFNFRWSGRISRFEFWSFYFINLAIMWAFYPLIEIAENPVPIAIIQMVYSLGTFWQILCAYARRFRDAGVDPVRIWWLLLPVIGWAMVIYWALQPGKYQKDFKVDPNLIYS